jgi:hypothetical protein
MLKIGIFKVIFKKMFVLAEIFFLVVFEKLFFQPKFQLKGINGLKAMIF